MFPYMYFKNKQMTFCGKKVSLSLLFRAHCLPAGFLSFRLYPRHSFPKYKVYKVQCAKYKFTFTSFPSPWIYSLPARFLSFRPTFPITDQTKTDHKIICNYETNLKSDVRINIENIKYKQYIIEKL